jgi:tRNA threonylcarbamoyladenosine biosynthesis protein TsaE
VTLPAEAPVLVADEDAMRALGAEVALRCRAGDVVILSGPLGAGKTTFAQGMASGLRVQGAVTSPTFVIARVHRSLAGGPNLVHVDAYRVGGLAELHDLDLDATLDDSVTVVEWGEGLAEHLGVEVIRVRIARDTGDERSGASEARLVTVSWPAPVG